MSTISSISSVSMVRAQVNLLVPEQEFWCSPESLGLEAGVRPDDWNTTDGCTFAELGEQVGGLVARIVGGCPVSHVRVLGPTPASLAGAPDLHPLGLRPVHLARDRRLPVRPRL